MSDNFKLIRVDIEEFKERIDVEAEEQENKDDNFLYPDPISYESALKEAKTMLEDFQKSSSVKMVIFNYEDGYQVDVVSGDPSYEIYGDLYSPEDVKCFVSWKNNQKVVTRI